LTLTADAQERVSQVPALLAEMRDLDVVVATLACGDYTIGDALGIERKTGSDLGRSIIDGRLFRQIGGLRRSFRRPILLVEGLSDGAAAAGVPWPAVRGALVSVSVCFGVPVLRAKDEKESAALIATAARQLGEPFDIAYVRPGYRPTGWRKRALYILQGLPGVGPQRARALLQRFGSVAAVVAADTPALAQVFGIGSGVAGSIREAVGDEKNAAAASRGAVPPRRIRSPSPVVYRTDS
jgi:ERCC4-type nuclease